MSVPGAVLAGVTAYQTTVMAAAWTARAVGGASTICRADPSLRFVVLIPAHNEERLIGQALESVLAVDYPAERVAVHVVADNCTDATSAIARAHGIEVHERVSPDAGKGPALQWLLGRLRDRGDEFDAVVILDADSSISSNFLRVMDALLAESGSVAQAYYAVRGSTGSTTTAFRATALAARHYLRPLGRTRLGGSAGLHGNGMAFRADVLAAHAWTNHLTEDIELDLELGLAGKQVVFAPDAIVEAEMPTTLEGSRTQHERWERGRIEMAVRYVPQLLRRASRARGYERVAYIDAALDQLTPPFSVVVAATAAWTALVIPAALLGRTRRRVPVYAAGALVACQTAYVLSALRMTNAPASLYRSLLSAPRHVAWKLALWTRVARSGRDVRWVRTERSAERDTVSCRVAASRDGRA
jgi:hypothetical protein